MPMLRPFLPLAMLPFLAGHAAAQSAPEAAREIITVYGSGEVRAVPDVASASFRVTKTGKTSREALDKSTKVATALVSGMKELGVESRDLRTSGFSVDPQYRYDNGKNGRSSPPVIVGYEVGSTLTVRIRDIGRLDEVLDRAVSLGATTSGGVSFDIDDPARLRIEARRKAMEDAKANAEALAEVAGVSLGKAVRIDLDREAASLPPSYYQDAYSQYYAMAQQMNQAALPARPAVPVEAGDQTVRAAVTVVFAIGGR